MAGERPFVHGRRVIDALIAAGIADENTQRVVIDVPLNGIPIVHVQKVADERLLEVLGPVAEVVTGVEVRKD